MNCVCIAMGWTKQSKKLQRFVGEIKTSKSQDIIKLHQAGKEFEIGMSITETCYFRIAIN